MTIIKALQDFLSGYSGMKLQKIKTDRPEEEASSYAVAMSGSGKITKDVVGNHTYQNSYIFLAREATADEIDRQDNYGFVEGLTEWLEEQNAAGNYPVLPGGYTVDNIEVANSMLVDLYDDGTGLYQIQIQLIIKKRRCAI